MLSDLTTKPAEECLPTWEKQYKFRMCSHEDREMRKTRQMKKQDNLVNTTMSSSLHTVNSIDILA